MLICFFFIDKLKDEILTYHHDKISDYIAEYEIIVKRWKSLEMIQQGFDIGQCINVRDLIIIYNIC